MDPALKESILGDLRIANALVLERRPDLGIPMFLIAFRRWEEARGA